MVEKAGRWQNYLSSQLTMGLGECDELHGTVRSRALVQCDTYQEKGSTPKSFGQTTQSSYANFPGVCYNSKGVLFNECSNDKILRRHVPRVVPYVYDYVVYIRRDVLTKQRWVQTGASESGPRSTPGQWNVTNSWQRLWTTKQQTVRSQHTHTDCKLNTGLRDLACRKQRHCCSTCTTLIMQCGALQCSAHRNNIQITDHSIHQSKCNHLQNLTKVTNGLQYVPET